MAFQEAGHSNPQEDGQPHRTEHPSCGKDVVHSAQPGGISFPAKGNLLNPRSKGEGLCAKAGSCWPFSDGAVGGPLPGHRTPSCRCNRKLSWLTTKRKPNPPQVPALPVAPAGRHSVCHGFRFQACSVGCNPRVNPVRSRVRLPVPKHTLLRTAVTRSGHSSAANRSPAPGQ